MAYQGYGLRNFWITVLLFVIGFATATGCTRQNKEAATVSIQFEKSIPTAGKVGALDEVSVLTHLAVNISGPGISPTRFIEADAHENGGVLTPLQPYIEVEVPSGSNRLIQVLAVYQDTATGQMTVKYKDTVQTLTAGDNPIDLKVEDVVAGFKTARVAGRFITGSAPFDAGPTGKLSVLFPVGDGRPDMIIQRGEMVNGWFSTFASGNVGLKYVLDSGTVIFDSLNLANLSGSNFAPAGDNYLRISAPAAIFTQDAASAWQPEDPSDLLTGFFAPEGQAALFSGHVACRGYSGVVPGVGSDNSGTAVSYDPTGGGAGYRGANGYDSATTLCNYGGLYGLDTFGPRIQYFSTKQLSRNSHDLASGVTGVFAPISWATNVNYKTGPFTKVAAGDTHTCAIDGGQNLSCWGGNSNGQLGDGTLASKPSATVVDSGTLYTQLAAGGAHTCAVTIANDLKCWGRNAAGQLGDGTTSNRSTPVTIASGMVAVSAGINHTCAITTSGLLKCWGDNVFGQLGNGTNTDSLTPALIDSGTTYQSVSVGFNSSCAITTSGVLKCWGQNNSGQIGNGTQANSNSPVVVDVGTTYSQVATSDSHACGLTTSGQIKCWGNNTQGALGDGTMTPHFTPAAISSSETFSSLALSSVLSCGLTASQNLHCWGAGGVGRADMSNETLTTPSSLWGDLFPMVSFSMGQGHTCGIQPSGAMVCFGGNIYGELGMPYSPPDQLARYRLITGGTVTGALFRTLPGTLAGDGYGGAHFDGVKVYMKAEAMNQDIESVDCSPSALAAQGYTLQNFGVTLLPWTRSLVVNFGASWPANNPAFVLCPTKSGTPVLGGVWFN